MSTPYYNNVEKTLVADCLKGNQQAQYELYDKYVQAMYNTVLRMVRNTENAEDIIQEVFVKVFRKLDSFQGDSTLGAWIKRITINTTLNFIRKEKKFFMVETEEDFDIPDEQEEEADMPYSMEQIHFGIKQLPERCRVVLSLFLLEGYQHKEIASILNITESTSKTQYRRGRQLLRQYLENQSKN